MNSITTFKSFDNGILRLPFGEKDFCKLEWTKHPVFEGVELKHLITSTETNGLFSYHLVRIAPNKSILSHVHATQLETHEVISGTGTCINNAVTFEYRPGTISIILANKPHEIHADNKGLYLFAKFFPALC